MSFLLRKIGAAAAISPARRTSSGDVFSVSAQNATSQTVSYPSGSANGDLLVMQTRVNRSVTGAITLTLSGGATWNLIYNQDDNTNGVTIMYYWCIRGSETSVTLTPSSTASIINFATTLVAYNGSTVDNTNPIGFHNGQFMHNGKVSYMASALTTTVNNCEILCMATGITTASASVTWTNATEVSDGSTNGGTQFYNSSIATATQATAGTTSTFTLTGSTTYISTSLMAMVIQPPIASGQTIFYVLPNNVTSYTVPAGVTSITSHCVGGGGGGAGVATIFSATARAGGAGGAYSRKAFSVSGGNVLSYSIGARGTASTSNGGAGGNTWFKANDATGCRAVGGGNATISARGLGTTTNCIGDTFFKGGDGALNSGSTTSGAAGGGGGSTGAGGNASVGTAGAGTVNFGGHGGAGNSGANNHGDPGCRWGGGGAGVRSTASNFVGGWGGPGGIVIEYVKP